MEPTVIFDGVFFQIAKSGIARVWASLFKEWSKSGKFKGAVVLDRLKTCPRFEGFIYHDFPAYDLAHIAEDSLLLEKICQHYNADVFVSTYYSIPISIPTLMMVYDMIPEKFDFNFDLIGWREKKLAIYHASAFVCISKNTAKDLLKFYPDIPDSSVIVAHCGVDRDVFYPRGAQEITQFRDRYKIEGDYYLFVGDRTQTKGYKNSQLFFNSLSKLSSLDFSIVCVGGNPELEDYIKAFTSEFDIHLLKLDDRELSICYSDAIALVYPSLYEGFGLPIVEAMACGCPLITTKEGSIPEAAGEAAYFITGRDEDEMTEAIVKIRDSNLREKLKRMGLSHITQFQWSKMAEITYNAICKVGEFRRECYQPNLIQYWSKYRKVLKDLQ
jgi:glycosyltransferase involved in cell wall biosynthesis